MHVFDGKRLIVSQHAAALWWITEAAGNRDAGSRPNNQGLRVRQQRRERCRVGMVIMLMRQDDGVNPRQARGIKRRWDRAYLARWVGRAGEWIDRDEGRSALDDVPGAADGPQREVPARDAGTTHSLYHVTMRPSGRRSHRTHDSLLPSMIRSVRSSPGGQCRSSGHDRLHRQNRRDM